MHVGANVSGIFRRRDHAILGLDMVVRASSRGGVLENCKILYMCEEILEVASQLAEHPRRCSQRSWFYTIPAQYCARRRSAPHVYFSQLSTHAVHVNISISTGAWT